MMDGRTERAGFKENDVEKEGAAQIPAKNKIVRLDKKLNLGGSIRNMPRRS